MLLIERILGDRHDGALAHRLHHLEHHGAVDVAVVQPADMARHRLRLTTEAGEEIAIALPRHEVLFDGAVLLLEPERAIVVRSAAERWLRIRSRDAADALELGYHAGNLHWRVRFDGADLLVAMTEPAESYAARLTPLLDAGRVELMVEAA